MPVSLREQGGKTPRLRVWESGSDAETGHRREWSREGAGGSGRGGVYEGHLGAKKELFREWGWRARARGPGERGCCVRALQGAQGARGLGAGICGAAELGPVRGRGGHLRPLDVILRTAGSPWGVGAGTAVIQSSGNGARAKQGGRGPEGGVHCVYEYLCERTRVSVGCVRAEPGS